MWVWMGGDLAVINAGYLGYHHGCIERVPECLCIIACSTMRSIID